ncbi:unnamed protein product [Adineta steineri]|uniref:Pentapeptide repeat-containing protein n=1 Tax=Adineta steineri TaxID=433720 RepID=A0A813VVR7_9BILA|nr:unnamed protein product [Adineta steineri]
MDCLKTKTNEVGKSKCSIFALLQLLATLSVPLAIGLYTIVHKTNESDLARQNRRKDLDIAGGNRAKDESIANEVRKENILVEYQNSLAKILLDHGMTLNGSVSARFVVRVKTLTAVKQLDTVRKAFLIQSLYEANLITTAVSTESIISLEGADLNRLHLGSTEDDTERPSHACLSLAGAILTNASFRLDNLNGANFTNAKLRFADFTDSRTDYGQYCYHQIPPLSVSFHSAILNEANFMTALYDNAIFTYAKMSKANLQKFTCRYCNVVGANLSEADLTGVTFNGPANIGWAKFNNSKLINASFTDGVNFQQSDFTRANANGISIRKCMFYSATFFNSTFNHATIINSDFTYARMDSIDISQGMITNSVFNNAHLVDVNFSHTTCRQCTFLNAILTGANFQGAIFNMCNFTGTQINDKQLEQASSLAGSILPNGTLVPN